MTCREQVLAAVAALRVRNGKQPVSVAEIVAEVARTGSRHAESTVRTHVTSHMCINAAQAPNWPDLRRVGRGLYVPVVEGPTQVLSASLTPSETAVEIEAEPGRMWPWEGAVQAIFAAYLADHGWEVTAVADTASKAHGVDVLAERGDRHLGAEVKGWPSTGYADPRRAEEVKPTQPTTQAVHWFSQAVMKSLMLLDCHPGLESLVVLPAYPRYRDLASRTRTGRTLAGVHVVLLGSDGVAESETWAP